MPHLLAVVAALSLAANVVFVPTAAAPACGPGTVACGPACYDPKDYNCDAAQLCPKPLRGCGNACYNTSDQECKNGQLKAVNGGCGKTLRPCKDDLGGDACYDPESGDYHCVEDNLIQGPGVNLNGKIGELDDGSTLIHGEGKRKLHLINSCAFPIWVGFEGDPLPLDGGIGLGSQKKTIVQVPNNWKSARVWGRTSCHYTKDKLACATGDCGNPRNKYKIGCQGNGAAKPATLAEFTFSGYKGTDYYDISNVDGYNIGIMIQPIGGKKAADVDDQYNCKPVSCQMDVSRCPEELMVRNEDGTYACSSISTAVNLRSQRKAYPFIDALFQDPDRRALVMCDCACGPDCGCESPNSKYCCSPYNLPSPIENGGKCYVESWPESPFAFGSMEKRYDQVFKSQCPMAYSWQFDDHRALMQCMDADYAVTFCPGPQYNLDASKAPAPLTDETTNEAPLEGAIYLDEDKWTEDFMKDFVVKLNSDNKISDSFDEDLSKFVWEKVSNDGLYPKTMYRMVLLGYVKAVEALRQHLDSVLVTDSKSVLKYTMISKDETSLDDPLRKEMMGPARDMFECKNGKGKGIDCPTKYRYPSADLNWIQKEDTNFKKHVWEKMQIPAQFLTTKNYEFWYHNGLPNQSNQKATWYNMFAIATTIDQAYMGSKSLGLFRGAVYDETQPELEKFLDENADKFFSCDGKSCHNFMDVNDFKVHDIQVRFSDETKFYDEVGEKFGLAKDSLKFGELKRDFFDKEAHLECAKKWNPPFPNSPNPCTKQKYTKEYRFNGVPSVNVETYPTSPTEATNNFLETSADRVEFLRNIIPEQDLSITVAAIEVAAGLVASGNGVVDYIKDYMDTIDDIKEESAQKEMAQKAMVGTIIMMILQAILFSFLPGAGPILAAANGAFQAVKATSMAVRIGKGLEQVKNLRDLVKNTSSIGKTVKAISELASGLKKAMPTAVKTRVSKGGEVFTKTKEFAVCIASEIGLDAIYDVGFTKIVDAAVLRRDMDGFMDISLPHPHESFSFPAVWMNETLIANAELERRANAPPNCFLEWQKSTDDFRSNEYRSNCEKDLVAATPLCPSDKDPWYAADKKKWDGGKCGTLDLACDHILELEEIKLFAENLSRKYTRKEFCKDWPKSLSQELFDKINSKDNLRGVEDTVNQLKNNMIHGNTVSSERLLNEQVVRNLHHGFSDKDQMTTIRKKMSEDVAEIFKKYKPTDSKIDITGDINEWKLERQTASANVFKALDDRIKAGNMGALNPIEPKKRPANRMLAGLDISEEDEERIRNAQADEDRPRTRRAASGPCAKKIKTG